MTPRIAAIVCGLSLVMAACGGSGEDSADTTSTSPRSTTTYELVTTETQVTSTVIASPDDDAACRADTLRLKRAILNWRDAYLEGEEPGIYFSPYPTNEGVMMGREVLEISTLHELVGDGTKPPTIVPRLEFCQNEEIEQLTG